MCQLIETIKISNGKPLNLIYHQIRAEFSVWQLFGIMPDFSLRNFIINNVELPAEGVHKLRIIYSDKIEKFEVSKYTFPKINSLKLIFDDQIDYTYKYLDRKPLNDLFSQKENCDDILIIKNNLVTDTYYANIIFSDGSKWITPETPLLRGTKRDFLLKEKAINEAKIEVSDIPNFKYAKLINSMIDIADLEPIPISNIL